MTLFLLPLLISCVFASVRIPIINNTVYASLRSSLGESVPMNMTLSAGRLSCPSILRPHDPRRDVSFSIVLNNTIGSELVVPEPVLYFPRFQGSESFFAIGPSSSIVNAHGSVMLIRGRANDIMVVTSDESSSEFISSCLEGGAMHIATSISDFGIVEIGVESNATLASLPVVINHIHGHCLLAVGDDLHERLIEQFTLRGAVRSEDSEELVSFSNCSRELVEALPQIRLVTESARLVLAPDDYIRMMDNGSSCELLIAASETDNITFNPLLLTFTNIRFTRRGVDICDSALTE